MNNFASAGALIGAPSAMPQSRWFRRNFIRLGIVSRLTLMGVITMSAAVAVSIWTSVTITQAEMYRRAQANLEINSKLLNSILSGYGAPSRKDNELYFGTTLINGNFEAVDRVKAIAGGTATVFLADLRVSTNVAKPDGSRAVGTKLAAGPAYDSVLGKRQPYRGEADILGETYLAIYEPIISGNEVIGIAYVGVKKAQFFSVLQNLVQTNLLAGLGVILFAGLAMLVLVRRIFAPIKVMTHELIEMAGATSQQEATARGMNEIDEMRSAVFAFGEPPRPRRLPNGTLRSCVTMRTSSVAAGRKNRRMQQANGREPSKRERGRCKRFRRP